MSTHQTDDDTATSHARTVGRVNLGMIEQRAAELHGTSKLVAIGVGVLVMVIMTVILVLLVRYVVTYSGT